MLLGVVALLLLFVLLLGKFCWYCGRRCGFGGGAFVFAMVFVFDCVVLVVVVCVVLAFAFVVDCSDGVAWLIPSIDYCCWFCPRCVLCWHVLLHRRCRV